MACLSEDAVLEFVEGRSAPAVVAEVDVHLASCSACRSVVADVADGLSRPMQLGRYEVVGTLGVGGMGVVYEAHDPHLHRRVALKVMRADHKMSDDAQARALREARAMAQVSHPNVVTVHDVGVVEGQIFIAMEYVDGSTLRAFMRTQPPWRLVLEHLLQAGEGLAAAHDAGLVHRDFKPDNVLLGKDGRVRVTDFGLARLASAPDEDTPRAPRHGGDVLTTLTRTNLFVGTPAYMAPEQFAGKAADPRSDQFAFSVVLYEAIYGKRPLKGANLAELTANALTAHVTAAPKRDEPAALRAALSKGLERDPGKRHASMRELLAALRASNASRSRRPRWIYAAIGATLLVPAGLLAAHTLSAKAPPAARSDPAPAEPTASAPATTTTQIAIASTTPSIVATPNVQAATKSSASARPRSSTIVRVHPSATAHSPLKPFDEDKH
jgi:serine/threonine protein kinase